MNNVKTLGRRYEQGGITWLCSSGSEISFTYTDCRSGIIRLWGDHMAVQPQSAFTRARYAIYHGEYLYALDTMDRETKEYVLPLKKDGSSGCVRIIKLSEDKQSVLGVQLDFDGQLAPLPDKKRRIEFIGDSLTCGYGIEGTLSHCYSTAIENITLTYAWKTAEMLDADAQYTCYSGHGIYSGYTASGNRNAAILVPECYDLVSTCKNPIPGHAPLNTCKWDFSLFTPDTIVINLGTNDRSFCKEDEDKRRLFRDAYIAFLRQVRAHNPGSRILCMLGMSGTGLNDTVNEAVRLYANKTGDDRVQFDAFPDQLSEDGYVPDWHPSEKTNRKTAERLVSILRSLE